MAYMDFSKTEYIRRLRNESLPVSLLADTVLQVWWSEKFPSHLTIHELKIQAGMQWSSDMPHSCNPRALLYSN